MRWISKFDGKIRCVTWLTAILLLSVVIFAQSLSAKTVIVAIGDSITKGDTSFTLLGHKNNIQGGWVIRLRNKLQEDFADEYDVINKGINGDTAQGVLNRLDRDVISLQPNIVIVGIGTNDTYGLAAVNTPARNANDYRVVMNKIFTNLKENLPNTPVFIMGMTTPLKKYVDMSSLSWVLAGITQQFLDTQFNQYNNVLKELAPKFGYFHVDVPSKWPSDIEESWELYAEGLHPNDAGYDRMTEVLYEVLLSTVSVEANYRLIATWGRIKHQKGYK